MASFGAAPQPVMQVNPGVNNVSMANGGNTNPFGQQYMQGYPPQQMATMNTSMNQGFAQQQGLAPNCYNAQQRNPYGQQPPQQQQQQQQQMFPQQYMQQTQQQAAQHHQFAGLTQGMGMGNVGQPMGQQHAFQQQMPPAVPSGMNQQGRYPQNMNQGFQQAPRQPMQQQQQHQQGQMNQFMQNQNQPTASNGNPFF